MAFTGQTLHDRELDAEPHIVAFDAAEDDVEVATNLRVIKGFAFGHIGTPGATELLSINETVSDDGVINVDADGNITVHRAAHTTSGLKVSLVLWGY